MLASTLMCSWGSKLENGIDARRKEPHVRPKNKNKNKNEPIVVEAQQKWWYAVL